MGITNFKISKIDFPLVICYLILVVVGWLNIYSAVYVEEHASIFDTSQRYGMQFIWLLSSVAIAVAIIFFINHKIYSVLSPLIYISVIVLLALVIFVGKEVNGSKSWFALGPISFQPAEVSKISTSLFLSYIMSKIGFKLSNFSDMIKVIATLILPMILIIMEKETGSALVYCGFIFVLYREGLSGVYLLFGLLAILLFVLTLSFSPLVSIIVLLVIFGSIYSILSRRTFINILYVILLALLLSFIPTIINIEYIGDLLESVKPEYIALIILLPLSISALYRGVKAKLPYLNSIFLVFVSSILLVFSVQFFFTSILQPHQRARIEILLGIKQDISGVGYNVHQSKIAIGSGGFFGKGFLEGTQTKFNFVPEQSTDFIFCTIGEEWGFLGASFIIALYLFMIGRIIMLAERQKYAFARLYGYCIASALFMHVFINIGMTMGLLPVIGIPLPFLSYGGSSLWTFTILLFIFIKLDLERQQ